MGIVIKGWRANARYYLGMVWWRIRRPIRVRCMDCGFLQSSAEGGEAGPDSRTLLAEGMTHQLQGYGCARSQWIDFWLQGDTSDVVIRAEVTDKRACSSFTRYRAGFDPKWHLEALTKKWERRAQFLHTLFAAFLGSLAALVLPHLLRWLGILPQTP